VHRVYEKSESDILEELVMKLGVYMINSMDWEELEDEIPSRLFLEMAMRLKQDTEVGDVERVLQRKEWLMIEEDGEDIGVIDDRGTWLRYWKEAEVLWL
jgi:hypothetical protein